MGKRLTREEFIEKAKKVHGDKYDYSKVEYVDSFTKVRIICSIHGEFWAKPYIHLGGAECPKCAHRSYKKTRNEFIEDARKIHGDKYDYSKVEYINNKTKVRIICPIHGEFQIRLDMHLFHRNGCPQCSSMKNVRETLLFDHIQNTFQIYHLNIL